MHCRCAAVRAEIAARDTGLVGDDDDGNAGPIGGGYYRGYVRAQHHFGRIIRIARIDIDGAVAIEEQRRRAGEHP
jgi:hypothetical protein